MLNRKVVITGLGVISSNGTGLEKFWENTVNGISGLKSFDWGKQFHFKGAVIGRVDDFTPSLYGISARQSDGQGRYLQFALAATKMAIDDAGLDMKEIDPFRIGVLIASAIADAASMEENLLLLTDNGRENVDPRWVGKHFYDNLDFGHASTEVAKQYGVAGPVVNLSTGCTAGLDALGFAFDQIRSGKVDVMIAGASEAPLCPLSIGSFEALGALSSRICENPSEASCPYSLERDGFVIAEGCGIFILESYESAHSRGAKIYAELAGYASVNNAYHMTDLSPEGVELARCIKLGLENAKCEPDEIDHISAHGSSTLQNDENETNAIKAIFGDRARKIPVNSLKSMTGHSLAAANAIEMVALCLEMKNKVIYPTINYKSPDRKCDLDFVPHKARPLSIRSAIKLTSGFSGIHSVLVLHAA